MTADAREILGDLIAFPTVATTPNGELIAYAAQRLTDAGAQVTVHGAHREDGFNLHAVLGPADAPDGVVLSGHTDVVAVEGQAWSRDPFALHAEDGRLYGRGTADMKGFIAAALAVAADTRATALHRPLHIVLSCDEEVGCRGIRPLLPTLATAIVAPRRCIVGEPTRLRVATRHKGKLALRVTVTGRATHSGHAPDGVNAVEYAARLIVALQEIAGPERDDRFPVPHPTVSTGPIRGGVSLNIVPDRCVFEVEVRLLPGQDADAVQKRAQDAADHVQEAMRLTAPEAGIAVGRLTAYPGLAGTGDGAALDFGTEAGLLQQALGEAPVIVCGPGDMAQGHKPDEFIEEAQLTAAVGLLRRELAALT